MYGLIQRLALALGFCGLGALSAAQADQKIVGGTPVAPDDPITATSVALVWDDLLLCTGTLIDYDLVLTAAHCLGLPQEVAFGNDARNLDAPRRRIIGAIAHPSFDLANYDLDPVPKDLHDIAVLRIAGPLPLTSKAARLLDSGTFLKTGAPVTIAGFGVDDARGESGQGPLRKAVVNVLSNEYAESEFQIDASLGSGDCSGDSGGPAFVGIDGVWYLAGVDNWGPGFCDQFGIYSRVTFHRDWIEETSRELRRLELR